VREGIKQSGVPREEIFITSKVDEPFGYNETLENISKIISVLNTTYVGEFVWFCACVSLI
jgi:diketogulonate reductase-like aldo/keto reductase